MRLKLTDLPDALRARVVAKMAAEDGVKATLLPKLVDQPAKQRTLERKPQSKTEMDYNRNVLKGSGRFEAITLRLPGGSRYTPDFMTVECVSLETIDDMQDGTTVHTPAGYSVTLHEVKGSYRLGSQGRALTAFKEAASAFPFFRFVWAERQKNGCYKIRELNCANTLSHRPSEPEANEGSVG